VQRRHIFITAIAIGALVIGGSSYALAASNSPTPNVCIEYGHGGNSAAGNVMLYNWDHQACPSGTYGETISGEPGSQGATGATGPTGPKGATGPTGPTGTTQLPTNITLNIDNSSGQDTGNYTCSIDNGATNETIPNYVCMPSPS
jgi:hypothetical protein